MRTKDLDAQIEAMIVYLRSRRATMCACEPGYVCSRCTDTPQDWRREWDEPREPERVTAEDGPDG